MKVMNTGRLMAWALVVAMPLWFGSCKKGDGGEVITPNSVEGSWKISGMKLSDGIKTVDYLGLMKENVGEDIVKCLTDTKITFNSNSTISGTPSPSCKSTGSDEYSPAKDQSTWKTNANKLTITDGDGAEVYDYTVNGSTMTWTIKEQEDSDGDGVSETYTTTIEFKRA